MKVFFVRHGESIFNKELRHQFPDTPLSNHGLKQAGAVASRFRNIPIEVILSSTYARALRTAREIEKITSVPLIENDLLIERKFPTAFRGKLIEDPEIAHIHKAIREHFGEPDWHHADEENFSDLMPRVKAAFDLIHSQNKKNIAVVTHGYFLTVMIYCMLFPDDANPQSFRSFREHTAYSNTGLTVCEYKDEKWKLLTWNDYAHLGE